MNSRGILDKLLQSGQAMLEQKNRPASRSPSADRGRASPAEGLDWQRIGAAALGSGLLGSLMGGKRQRRGIGGRMARISSLAALAGIAYQAYGQWQRQKQAQGALTRPRPVRPLDQLPEEEVEHHSQAVLKAIIAAAKADGHIDDQERGMIESELAKEAGDDSLRQWLDQELRSPLDPRDVARAADTPELAMEMYTASLLVADERNAREQRYLDELAQYMNIPPDLKASLEQQVRSS